MCGIAGLIGVDESLAREVAPRILAAIRHRGPDDQDTQRVLDPRPAGAAPPAVLLHARLAILDLSPAGHQPMSDVPPPNSNLAPNWITFNGEIFNFLDLQPEVARAGWPCRTRCDTEVILHGYRAWGEASLERFHGMFAWCLLDTTRGCAWLCRDRFGVKPLYLYRPRDGGGLIFASELRAILAAGSAVVPPDVSRPALESLLAQGAVYGPQSIVRGVELLGPGESLLLDWNGNPIHRKTYWSMPTTTYDPLLPRAPVVAELARRLREAVRIRLISDVPLGLFLSGGIDSAAIATVATEVARGGADVHTICIGFDQSEYDETAAAAAVA
jgi:asparagine synthase (glutamine-hydrolysing)